MPTKCSKTVTRNVFPSWAEKTHRELQSEGPLCYLSMFSLLCKAKQSVKTKSLSLKDVFWWRFLTHCTTAWAQNRTAPSDADLHMNCLLSLAWLPGKHLTFTRTYELKKPTWTDIKLSSFKATLKCCWHSNTSSGFDAVLLQQLVYRSLLNSVIVHRAEVWRYLKKKNHKTLSVRLS